MLSRATFNIVRRSLYNRRTLYCLQSNVTYNSSVKQHSVQNHCNLYIVKRHKSNKKRKEEHKQQSNEDESSDEDVEEEEAPVGSKIITINTQSVRLDVISKAGFAVSRNKIEEEFYASKIRLNGQKVFKKSKEVNIGDEIDLILHRDENNPSLLVVNRIKILSIVPGSNNIKTKISRDKNLLIENYEEPEPE